MTISSTTREAGPFTGNDTADTFAFAFKVFATTDVYVERTATATGVISVLVMGTDYTVSLNADQNVSPGGDVVLTSALATGYTLAITSDVAQTQPTDFTNQGGFYPAVLNQALDRLTILNQQTQKQVDRSIKAPLGESASSLTLPAAADRANKTPVFDDEGNLTVSATPADVQEAVDEALEYKNDAGASATAAATSATAAAASAVQAEGAQVGAEAAALEAENYAAAAATGATFYNTIALGLAAVASGATFGVKAGGTDGLTRPTVYRDDAGVPLLLYAVVPGTEFDAEVDRIDSIVGEEFESIGRTGTPVTGGDNSDSTTIILRPATQDGQIKRVRAFLGAGATALNVKVFRGSSSVLNQVSTTAITAAAGLNDFDADLAEFTAIDVLEGDILGWYVTGGRMQFAAGSSDPFQQTAGNVTTFTPSGTVSTAVFAIGFDIEHTDYLTREEAEATDRRSKRLGSTLTQTIGRPSGATLVTGTAAPGQTLVMEEAATEDGEITTVRLWALATGTFDVMAFDVIDGVFVATGEKLTLTAGSTGLNTFTDFTPLRIKRGQRIGFYGGSTRLARITATSDSSGFYNGLGTASAAAVVFPKGTLFTTVQFQISFDISYFKSSAVQFVLTTQVAYDALGTKDADTLYGIV